MDRDKRKGTAVQADHSFVVRYRHNDQAHFRTIVEERKPVIDKDRRADWRTNWLNIARDRIAKRKIKNGK